MLTAADTAYSIAALRALERELPEAERLFDDPYAAIFARAGAHANEGTRRLFELPFFADGVRLRTRGIDDFVRAGLATGARQIVLLGAGFDARALRMPEIADRGATVFEVDFARQLEEKRRLVEAAGVRVPAHVRFVPCDFSEARFADALTRDLETSGFRAGAGALFVWEGVIAYIDAAAVERTLRFVVSAGGAGSRLAFDFASIAFDPPAEEQTRRAGFTRFEATTFDELWRRHLPGDPHPNAVHLSLGVGYV